MIDLFSIINNLYVSNNCNWINEVDSTIQARVIQRWLVMNDALRVQVRWLDKYVDLLPLKMYLSLAWSIIPKVSKTPFIKYIKQQEDEEEYDFILPLIKKHLKLSDNDFRANKTRIITSIKKNPTDWFSYYGITKPFWKKYQLNYNLIKEYGETPKQSITLANWGI